MTLLPKSHAYDPIAREIRSVLIGTFPLLWQEIMIEGMDLLDEIGLFDLQ